MRGATGGAKPNLGKLLAAGLFTPKYTPFCIVILIVNNPGRKPGRQESSSTQQSGGKGDGTGRRYRPNGASCTDSELLPVSLFEMKELVSILVTIYLLGISFLPVSSYLAQTLPQWLSPRSLGCYVLAPWYFQGPSPK
jgi:hypothetical protein